MTNGRYVVLTCPVCGGKLEENQNQCAYCGNQLVFETFETQQESFVQGNTIHNTGSQVSQGGNEITTIIDLIKKKRYKAAIKLCDEMLAVDLPEVPYLKCIALIEGKKPFLLSRAVIDECIELTDESLDLGVVKANYLLRAYLEHDYFERKFLNRNPNYRYFVEKAKESGISQGEKEELEELLANKIYF